MVADASRDALKRAVATKRSVLARAIGAKAMKGWETSDQLTEEIFTADRERRELVLVVPEDTCCDSCANANLKVEVSYTSTCSACEKVYGRKTRVVTMKRKDVLKNLMVDRKGFCGSRACSLKREHADWELSDCELIAKGSYRTGFTKEQVVAVMGRPRSITRTVLSGIDQELWWYGDRLDFLCFENGRLEGWQNSR